MITAALQALADLSLRTKVETGCVVLALAGGALWWVTRPPAPIPEVTTAALQARQGDGSLIAARAPDAHPAAPPHAIPKGYREERRESATIAPSAAAAASGCPPVRVALSIVNNGKDKRAVVSSPDGQVIDAQDIVIEPALIPPPPKPWAAGLSYDTRRAVGIWVDRDIGRAVAGFAVARLPDGKVEAQVRLGVRF